MSLATQNTAQATEIMNSLTCCVAIAYDEVSSTLIDKYHAHKCECLDLQLLSANSRLQFRCKPLPTVSTPHVHPEVSHWWSTEQHLHIPAARC